MRSREIEKVLLFIDEHIEETFFLTDIAKHLGYSPFYVSRSFSQIMGISIISYVRMRKLQFAFSSLQKGKTVLEVACQYGFESHEGFTRAFKRFFGFAPKVLKEQTIPYTIPEYCVLERSIEIMNNRNIIEEMHMMAFLLLKESILEMKEGYCSQIQITLLPDNYVEITDDGRGIPLVEEVTKCKLILNQIFGGHPISSLDYANIEDFHHLTLNMVNSLCEHMSLCIWRGGKHYQQDYINGVAQHELFIEPSPHPSGMNVVLKPNTHIFGNTAWSKELFEQYVSEHAAVYTEFISIKNASIK